MPGILKTLLELCQGRGTPAALPAGTGVMNAMLIGYALTSVLALQVFRELRQALPIAIGAATLLALLTYIVLTLKRRTPRAPQTIGAVAGTGAVMNVVTLPGYLLVLSSGSFGLAGLVNLITIGWSLYVVAHIFKAALDEQFGPAMLWSLGYHAALLVCMTALEPVTQHAPVAMLMPGASSMGILSANPIASPTDVLTGTLAITLATTPTTTTS